MELADAPKLPKAVMTPEDVVQFFAYLFLVDRVAFHPDDVFLSAGVVQHVRHGGGPLYTPAQADQRDRLMRQAWSVDLPTGDLYEVALWTGGWFKLHSPEVMDDAPPWILEILRKGFPRKQDWSPRKKGKK